MKIKKITISRSDGSWKALSFNDEFIFVDFRVVPYERLNQLGSSIVIETEKTIEISDSGIVLITNGRSGLVMTVDLTNNKYKGKFSSGIYTDQEKKSEIMARAFCSSIQNDVSIYKINNEKMWW